MRITFLGGADEVGASALLLEIAGRRLLVDVGIRPSPKARHGLAGDQLPDLSMVDHAGGVDAILVTHAHTDHTGALELVAERCGCPVYATPLSIALIRVLHNDSRRIMQSRLEEEDELPLFDDVAVQKLEAACVPAAFNTRLALGSDLAVTFFPAGHIAGAAMIGIESGEGNMLVSGDLSITPQRTVDGAKPPPFKPDVLLIESTYGGRLHANRAAEERRLVETVAQVIEQGGKVLIPAFALGRAQELVLTLREAQRRHELDTPVWIDGMVRQICTVYASFAEEMPLPFQELGARFFGDRIQPVQQVEQRAALAMQTEPVVIIASSGMLAGGPSSSYARALAGQANNAILLTGYQDEESPGRRLQEMAASGAGGTLRLGQDKLDVQCRLGLYSLSAHADEGQLVSLVETLGPSEVVLVHGEPQARQSLEARLRERKHSVHTPLNGQALEFRFAPSLAARRRRGIGKGQPLDVRALWVGVAGPAGGGYFTADELAATWWGDAVGKRDAVGKGRVDELKVALEQDQLYFSPDSRRPGVYRAHTKRQIASLQAPPVSGTKDGAESQLPAQSQSAQAPAGMEPNQALAFVREQFPQGLLRRCGYHLGRHTITLTFDLPDAARRRFADVIEQLPVATGWQIEIDPEANQAALIDLARRTAGSLDLGISKGPAVHRSDKRVAFTASGQAGADAVERACRQFQEDSGYRLDVTLASVGQPVPSSLSAAAPAGQQWEINSAYAEIRRALAGSTLYRTSLKNGKIVLSFISPQVGNRYQAEIAALAQRIGWELQVAPQPKQDAILSAARQIVADAGWTIVKGPGIRIERGEVEVVLAGAVDEASRAEAALEFERQSGYRLVFGSQSLSAVSAAPADVDVVEIPLERIRFSAMHQGSVPNPDKLNKALGRAQRMGRIEPPIQVRRLKDGYLLMDGWYRVLAAQALGWVRIAATVQD